MIWGLSWLKMHLVELEMNSGMLGNGKHAHVIVASTGSPKTVNVGNGGFHLNKQYKFN